MVEELEPEGSEMLVLGYVKIRNIQWIRVYMTITSFLPDSVVEFR